MTREIERKFIQIVDNHAVVEVSRGKEKRIEIWKRLAPS